MTALQFAAACQSQPQLAAFHQGHHPSLDSNALLKGEVEHLVSLSKSSAMLALCVVTNTSQHVRVPAHKLPHTFSHVLPCNSSPKAQRPAMGRMKIVDRSLVDTSPSTCCQVENLSHWDWQREEAEVKNDPEVFTGKPPCS